MKSVSNIQFYSDLSSNQDLKRNTQFLVIRKEKKSRFFKKLSVAILWCIRKHLWKTFMHLLQSWLPRAHPPTLSPISVLAWGPEASEQTCSYCYHKCLLSVISCSLWMCQGLVWGNGFSLVEMMLSRVVPGFADYEARSRNRGASEISCYCSCLFSNSVAFLLFKVL